MYSKLKILFCLTLALVVFTSVEARAQSLAETQSLDFGEGLISDNSAQRAINLQANGAFTNDPEIFFVTTPQVGIYALTGATPLLPFNVGIVVDQQVIGPGEDFTIDNFDIDAPAATDGSGEATIRVGARLRTSGTGTPYTVSSAFAGQFTITVTF